WRQCWRRFSSRRTMAQMDDHQHRRSTLSAISLWSHPGAQMTVELKPAVILLSGGLDSSTVLAIAKSQGYTPYAMTFRYGQRHQSEIDAATRIAKKNGVAQHIIADIDLRIFGGSALTSDIAVPKGEQPQEGIPITY